MNELSKKCQNIRKNIIQLSYKTNSPHLGSSLSSVEILVSILNEFKIRDDELIFSKGHAALCFYSSLVEFHYLKKSSLKIFLNRGTKLWSHITKEKKNPFFKYSFGSLGYGPGISAGIAYLKKIKKKSGKIYCVISDGELNEGSIWEAILFISHYKLNNIVIFVDKNSWQSFGRTREILNLGNLKKKFQCFNFDTYEINGHSTSKIISSIKKKTKLPKIIICNTIKGKGVKRIEDKLSSHYYPAREEDLK
jgi:transketolase